MYLKEIKTVGFKSFADKINIELGRGINGVVGPNGSGKSNVVDAVRWVLGEQSVKELRGEGAMSDIIFSGSNSRRALNSASVTLVFDNSDKHLQIDYSEVSIKRRVYKTGENEYYLNNEKCRLKDITNLLTDSGIGKESFNIISQGKVQEILSNKPEERRVIFEEAAGVLKYKKRKEEAIRKLKRTHDNLDRVQDIIGELEIQVEPLRKQSEKARTYIEEKEALKSVEIALIANDIETINYEYQNSKNQIDILNNELSELGAGSSSEEASLESEKQILDTIERDLFSSQNDLIFITKTVEQLDSKKKIALERKQYEVEDTKLHNNAINLKEQQLKIENEINVIKKDITFQNEDLLEIKENLENINNNFSASTERRTSVNIDLTKKTREIQIIKHKIEILRNTIDNNGTIPYSVKAVLDNPKLNGVVDVIGNLIDTEKDYALAIETSLGSAINFLVTDNDKTAKEAIKFLRENRKGRATFFPLNIIKERYIPVDIYNSLEKEEGFINIASSLITFDPKYTNIITNQLGTVIIADNIDNANRISKKINHRYKVVTLEGNVVNIGGSLTGGNVKQKSGLISERYELESLLKDKEKVIKEIKELEEFINEVDYKLNEITQKRHESERKKTIIVETINNKETLLNSIKVNYNNVLEEIKGISDILDNNLNNEEEKLISDYYEAVKEKESKEKEISRLREKMDTLKNEIETKEFEIRKSNSVVNTKLNDLKKLEINVNRMDVKLDNLLNTLSEDYEMTFDNAKSNYKLEMVADEARVMVNSIKSKIRQLGIVNIAAIEEFERVNTRYTFLTDQKDDLVNAENTLLDIVKEMDEAMEETFEESFNIIKEHFKDVFKQLFGGGQAELKLTDPSNILETGIEIVAQPPGKKLQHLTLLSGGEKTLTAISLLFAILKARPVPFCILDEVEAALDEVNVDNFGKFLEVFKEKTQFVVITHKKKTMEYADILYGITMQESGVSKLVSVKLEEIENNLK